MIRLLVADDHAEVRVGLRRLVRDTPDVELVGVATDGVEAVALAAELLPDVVLMDLSMPCVDGLEATRRIVATRPTVHVVVLTLVGGRTGMLDARDAGAVGYLTKDAEPDEILSVIRAAARGKRAWGNPWFPHEPPPSSQGETSS